MSNKPTFRPRNPHAKDPIMKKGGAHTSSTDYSRRAKRERADSDLDEAMNELDIDPDVLTNVRIK